MNKFIQDLVQEITSRDYKIALAVGITAALAVFLPLAYLVSRF